MTQQPEALRLADELRAAPERSRTSFEAAAELRRLHAQRDALLEALQADALLEALRKRDALLEALKEAAEALEIAADNGGVNFYQYAKEARAAIKAVEETK